MPTAQGFSLRDRSWLEICELAVERQVPITLHVTEPVGHLYPGRVETPLEDYVWLGEQFPALRLVLAHWGGGLPFFCLNRRVRRALAHARFDTAASPLLYDPQVWTTVVNLIGAERILFGTDYPLRLRPRQTGGPSIKTLVDEVHAAALGAAATRAILGDNARAWLPTGR